MCRQFGGSGSPPGRKIRPEFAAWWIEDQKST
jgi:hypothetical protein